jgi:hypothetical protein
MTWEIINSIGRVLLTVVVVVKVTRFGETLNKVERAGLGFMGGGSLLTVPVIWDMQHSPFLDWSTTLITYGALMFIAGRTWRDWGHEWRNRMGVEQARRHLIERGKL